VRTGWLGTGCTGDGAGEVGVVAGEDSVLGAPVDPAVVNPPAADPGGLLVTDGPLPPDPEPLVEEEHAVSAASTAATATIRCPGMAPIMA